MPKRAARLLSMLAGAALLSTCVHPSLEVYGAALAGSVTDQAGKPIAGATVARVEDYDRDPEADSIAQQVATTDASGGFRLPELKRVRWWHEPMEYLMGWVHCYAFIQVRAEGYQRFNSTFGDPSLTRDAHANIGCNGAKFVKAVALAPVMQPE